MSLKLVEVKTKEQVEWLRVQRNDPLQYKWFRQDKPITPEQQFTWWRHLDKTKVKLFIIEEKNKPIGYVGFNPLNRYSSNAEFGIFIIKEFQGKGYAKEALMILLKYGFEDLNISTIHSECFQYPNDEDRLAFYKGLGFIEYENRLGKWYTKQGKRVKTVPFYMNKDRWNEIKK